MAALRRSRSVESPKQAFDGECGSHALHQPGTIMTFILPPWQPCFTMLAGWVNRQQQEVVDYVRTEKQVLEEKLGQEADLAQR